MPDVRQIESFLAAQGPDLNCLPLSFAQERFWLVDQLSAGPSRNHVGVAFHVDGALDEEALRRAIREICARHEILRTRFRTIDGYPVQVVLPPGADALETEDIAAAHPSAAMTEALDRARRECQRPRDLAEDPIFRARLYRLAAAEHLFLVIAHHIIWDEGSTAVLIRELKSLYEAFVAGRSSPLARPRLQYGDYALWQRQHAAGPDWSSSADYWRQRLRPLPDSPRLPGERSADTRVEHVRRNVARTVPSAVFARAEELSRNTATTLFVVLMSALRVLLYRETTMRDLVLLVSVSERSREELDGLIGPLLNLVCFRLAVGADETFRTLLRREAANYAEAWMHADYPMQRVVSALPELRGKGAASLSRVALTLFHSDQQAVFAVGATQWRRAALEFAAPPKFDLALMAQVSDGVMRISMEFDAGALIPSVVSTLLDDYIGLLAALTDAPDRPVPRAREADADAAPDDARR